MKTEISLFKTTVTKEMIGRTVLIPLIEKSKKDIETIPDGRVIASINHGGKHHIKRHDTFWACASLVSENSNLTLTQVVETCKIDCRWIKGYTVYRDKNGSERVNVITRSISFSAMSLTEANEFYSKSFDVLASYLSISTEKLIEEAKKRMG